MKGKDSPSHKLWEAKLPFILLLYIIVPAIILFLSVQLFSGLERMIYYDSNDLELMKKVEKVYEVAEKKYGYNTDNYDKFLKKTGVKKVEQYLERKYADVGLGYKALGRGDFIGIIITIVLVGGFASFYFWFTRVYLKKKEDGFFFRKYKKEIPLQFSKDWKKIELEWDTFVFKDEFTEKEISLTRDYVVSMFKSPKHYIMFLGTLESNIFTDEKLKKPKELEEMKKNKLYIVEFDYEGTKGYIRDLVIDMTNFAVKTGLIDVSDEEEIKKFMVTMSFVLLHKITRYYGGVPTGLVSVLIKDYTLKRVLGTYEKNKILVTEIKGKIKIDDVQPSRFLRVWVEYFKLNPDKQEDMNIRYEQLDYRVIAQRRQLAKSQ